MPGKNAESHVYAGTVRRVAEYGMQTTHSTQGWSEAHRMHVQAHQCDRMQGHRCQVKAQGCNVGMGGVDADRVCKGCRAREGGGAMMQLNSERQACGCKEVCRAGGKKKQ